MPLGPELGQRGLDNRTATIEVEPCRARTGHRRTGTHAAHVGPSAVPHALEVLGRRQGNGPGAVTDHEVE